MGQSLDRRNFIGAAGAVIGMGVAGSAAYSGATEEAHPPLHTGTLAADIRALVDKTPIVDTHEHLWSESKRIQEKTDQKVEPALDFGYLFGHYSDADLRSIGMPQKDISALFAGQVAPRDKWKRLAPYYARSRNTGYMRFIRESVRALYDEDDIREDNCEAIGEKLYADIQPGFYKRILVEVSNIEYTHVNALDGPVFRATEEQPELLAQDLWIVGLGSAVKMSTLEQCAGGPVGTLEEAHGAIDRAFAEYGPRAIAVKDQSAYGRSLDYRAVSNDEAALLFARFAKDEQSLTPEELKTLQNHLFRYCVTKATEYNLPVKLHTGYGMVLERNREHLTDLRPVMADFPDTKFVLMHIAYPYQDALIALCKQMPQVYVDMCWAWILNPAASVRFVKEFLMAAPASKLFPFGGDFRPVELVPGHVRMARQGIAQALTELVMEGWLAESDLPDLVERLLRGNAHEHYDLERTLKNWG